MKKRILSFVLALAAVSNLCLTMVPDAMADEADEIIGIEEYTDATVAEDVEPDASAAQESEAVEPEESVEEEQTTTIPITVDILEEPEAAAVPTITGFCSLTKTQYALEKKLPLDELTAMFPQTLSVYLDHAPEPQDLSVCWQCESDYAGTEEQSYVFKPVWDTQSYTMDQELSSAIPKIEVSLNSEQEQAAVRVLAEAAPVLTAISGTTTKVTLQWTAVSNANKYHIYRKTSGSTSWVKIGATESLTYTDETAKAAMSYSYAVRAIFVQNGTETRSERSEPFVRVGRPTLNSVQETGGGISLSWKAVGDATGYAVYRRTSTKANWTLLQDVTKTTATDSTAKLGTKYYYAVRAVCTNGGIKFFSAYSSAKSVKRTLATPKVTSISGTKTKVTLKWKSVSGAKKYRIRRMVSGGSWKTIGSTTKLTYQDKTAKASKTYRYRVCAVKTSAGKTICGMGQVPGIQRPGTTSLTSAVSEANGIRVTWKAVSSVKKYRVYRRQKSGAKWKRIATVSDTSYLDTKASTGTTYWYTVRAVGQNPTTFYGGYNTTGIKAKRSFTAPALTQISNTSTGVKLQWGKAGNAVGYRVYRKTAGASKWTTIKSSTTQTSYTDKTAVAGKKYTYAIRAIDKSKNLSGYSSSRSITYLKMPTVKGALYTGTGIQVTWGSVSGASGYYVYRKTNGSGTQWSQLAKVKGKAAVTYTDKTAVNGTLYDYTVCAYYGTTKSAMNQTGVSEFYLKPVALLDLIQAESRCVELSWETNAQADGYMISYSTSESFSTEKTVRVNAGKTKITGLIQDEIYYFRVKAYKQVSGKQYETAWSESQIVAIES